MFKPGDHVIVCTSETAELNGRPARLIEQAAIERYWRVVMLDKRDWPKNTYDWAVHETEMELGETSERTVEQELEEFVDWLHEKGVVFARHDTHAVFYYDREPLVRERRDRADFVRDYIREHGRA